MLAARREQDRMKDQKFQQGQSLRKFIPKNQSKPSNINAKKPKVSLENVKSDYAPVAGKFKNNQQRLFDLDTETRRKELIKI